MSYNLSFLLHNKDLRYIISAPVPNEMKKSSNEKVHLSILNCMILFSQYTYTRRNTSMEVRTHIFLTVLLYAKCALFEQKLKLGIHFQFCLCGEKEYNKLFNLPKITLTYDDDLMTWLWEKIRYSLRSGRLGIRIRKLLQVDNSDHLNQFSDNDDESEEWAEDELTSYSGICSTCKLAINHYRHLNLSAIDFLSARNSTCPFCGLRYRNASERRTIDNNEIENVDEIKEIERREQRSSSDPTISHYRLPPINDTHSDNIRIENCENENGLFRRLENFNKLSPNTRTNRETVSILESQRTSLISQKKRQNNICEHVKKPTNCAAKYLTRNQFLKDLRKARQLENYTDIEEFYTKTFNSFSELCAVFKINPIEEGGKLDDAGLKMEFLFTVHDTIEDMPSIIQKTILKSIVNSLLEESKIFYDKDDVRSVFILFQCPIFIRQDSYVVFAHLLRYCMKMSSSHHQLLAGWFKT
ncbi:hypothetical protein PGB90_000819 [Kerria lacca]